MLKWLVWSTYSSEKYLDVLWTRRSPLRLSATNQEVFRPARASCLNTSCVRAGARVSFEPKLQAKLRERFKPQMVRLQGSHWTEQNYHRVLLNAAFCGATCGPNIHESNRTDSSTHKHLSLLSSLLFLVLRIHGYIWREQYLNLPHKTPTLTQLNAGLVILKRRLGSKQDVTNNKTMEHLVLLHFSCQMWCLHYKVNDLFD